ncbi:mechanosensitive ion channel domain-containing protein [Flavobacterium sp.]|uniref:mechanosensitive ion channel domain-containing protein n=1 Tax=Flavobacterium sp. TaxID=239 RepID=UPI0035B3434F
MDFFSSFTAEVIASIIVLIVYLLLRIITAKLIRKYARTSYIIEQRTNLVIKYIYLLLNILFFIALTIIWGVEKKDILFTISSVATIVGVAMFAQWSILSNITSGIILFFFFPFKIGDTIKIHDKDFPIEGEIEDINAFHVDIKTINNEKITYPNNLLLQKGISIIKNEHEQQDDFTD